MNEALPGAARDLVATLMAAHSASLTPLGRAREQRQRAAGEGVMPAFAAASDARRDPAWRLTRVTDAKRDGGIRIAGPPSMAFFAAAIGAGAESVTANFEDGMGDDRGQLAAGHAALHDAMQAYPHARMALRPRGLHRIATGLAIDGTVPAPAFVDLAMFLTDDTARSAGGEVNLELAGLQSPAEAGLWAEALPLCEHACGLAAGTIRVTLLLDNVHCAFALDELLYALRDYAVAVQQDLRNYVAAYCRLFWRQAAFVLPDPGDLVRTAAFLKSLSRHQLAVCRQRGAAAIADLAWQGGNGADEMRATRVLAEAERALHRGFGGLLVHDPADVAAAAALRDKPDSGDRRRDRVSDREPVRAAGLLQVAKGKITEYGARTHLRTALRYLAHRDDPGVLPGTGNCPDRAAARVAHHQLWQWVHHITGILDSGRNIDLPLIERWLADIGAEPGTAGGDACPQLLQLLTQDSIDAIDRVTL